MKPHNHSRVSKKTAIRLRITSPATIGAAICLVAILVSCAAYVQHGDDHFSPSATISLDNGMVAIPQNVDWLRPQATVSAIALNPVLPVEQAITPTVKHINTDISVLATQKADTHDADIDAVSRNIGMVREVKAVRCRTPNTWFLPLRERNNGETLETVAEGTPLESLVG